MTVRTEATFRAICMADTLIYAAVKGGYYSVGKAVKNRIYTMRATVVLKGDPCFALVADSSDPPAVVARVVRADCFRRIEPRATDISSLQSLLSSSKGEAA